MDNNLVITKMKNVRIIARLDIKGPNLVKGIHLEGLRVLGKPEEFAELYYKQGADELIYQDVVASLYNRNSLHDIISRTAKNIFIPLTVGGGLRTIDDIRAVLRAGADKVALNTAVINNPSFIKEASLKFGSSTIVVTIETIKQPDGKYLCYTDTGREYTGIDALSWATKVDELGAGEIVLTSVDREGTGEGFDIELTKMISEAVSIPIIAHGGGGNALDVYNVINQGKADAVSISSILHYGCVDKNIQTMSNRSEGNIEFLKSGRTFSKITPLLLLELKSYLKNKNLNIR